MPAVGSLLLLLALLPTVAFAEDRPNILLLMAEDMSPRVGAFGDPVAVTPNLDRLAAEGISYTNVFTTAGVCAPSRAAIIMGMHQESFGAQHMRSNRKALPYYPVPPAEARAFPEMLRESGYHTQVTLKLDYQFSGTRAGTGPSSIWDQNDADTGFETQVSQPFFAYLTYMETHESGIFERWAWPKGMPHLTAQLMHIWFHWNTEDEVEPEDVTVPPYYPDSPAIRTDIARHYNNIKTMDLRVGEVLDRLKEDGLEDNTIVVWTTDHGDALPRAKRELFDSGVHVPMIIRWPEKYRPAGAEPGSTSDRLISLMDLGPTFLSLANIKAPDTMHGKAFAGAYEQLPRDYVFAARDRIDRIPDRQRAVRDKRFKYIYSHNTSAGGFRLAYRDIARGMQDLWRHLEEGRLDDIQMQWFSERPAEMLFDTLNDPHEVNNLASDPAYGEVLQRLRDALAEHRRTVYDYSEEMSEEEMAAQFWPNGQQPVTATPDIMPGTDAITIVSDTDGASIEYRFDEGSWQLYTAPVSAGSANRVEARAVRYGWATSEITGVMLSPAP